VSQVSGLFDEDRTTPVSFRPARARTDEDLAHAALDAALLARYDHLVRLASLIVGADAEDAVMDAFLRVRSRPRHLDEPAAYLRMAVLNECRSRWRRSLRTPKLVLRPVDSTSPDVDTVWQVLGELPRDQRVVVALRFYEDLTVPQIADVLGLREGTVKSHLHRALKVLRPRLEDHR